MSLETDWFLRAHPEINTIEVLLPDCNGVMRGKWLPRHKLDSIFAGELKLPKSALKHRNRVQAIHPMSFGSRQRQKGRVLSQFQIVQQLLELQGGMLNKQKALLSGNLEGKSKQHQSVLLRIA